MASITFWPLQVVEFTLHQKPLPKMMINKTIERRQQMSDECDQLFW
jgi:hypothetical protein